MMNGRNGSTPSTRCARSSSQFIMLYTLTKVRLRHWRDCLMKRTIFESEHNLFRESFQAFLKREIAPYYPQWEREGIVPRELWLKAGQQGFLGLNVPEEFGGAGVSDFRFNTVL